MAERKVAEVFRPGEFIRDELEERGWTQSDLAEILGRPTQVVNEVISGKKAITPETAKGLASAFGTSPELWLNLENAYRLSLTKTNLSQVTRRARVFSLAPVREMVKRGWIHESSNIDVLEEEVCRFYGMRSVDDEPSRCFAAARKSSTYAQETPAQTAWCHRARQLARTLPQAKTFSKRTLTNQMPELRRLSTSESGMHQLPAFLSHIGIRFVVVEHLPKTRIDGASFQLSEGEPVIALSLRYGRIDHFWFTLMHELAHIHNGDSGSLDSNLVGREANKTDAKPEHEKKADKWASEALVPSARLSEFVRNCGDRFSKQAIRQFAELIGVHPGVVVGQLQHKDSISYSHSREMLMDIRDIITETAVTDGWGKRFDAAGL